MSCQKEREVEKTIEKRLKYQYQKFIENMYKPEETIQMSV